MTVNYKVYIIGLVLIALVSATVNFCKRPEFYGNQEYARERIKELLADTTKRYGVGRIELITSHQTAVRVVEPILFDIYGKEKILSERPYEVEKIGTYWVVSGTLPRGYLGGAFEIIIDSRDAKVLSVTHYK